MTRIFLIFLLQLLFSCVEEEQKTKPDLVKQYDYRIVVEEWNGFAGYYSKFILNNLRINTFDSSELKRMSEKPLTLYHITYRQTTDPQNENTRIFKPADTTEIRFSKKQSDTLFNLTRAFFQSLEFSNYDTAINGTITKPVIMDDSDARVELSYGGLTVSARVSSISNPTIATPQLNILLTFVSKFEPKKNE